MTEEIHKLNPNYRKGYQPWMKKKRRRRAFKGIVNQAPPEPKLFDDKKRFESPLD